MIVKKNFLIFFYFYNFFIDRLGQNNIIMINLAKKIYEFNIKLTSFLNFDLIWNDGIAFGLFSFNEANIIIIL